MSLVKRKGPLGIVGPHRPQQTKKAGMRLVTWNCCGGFAKKYQHLADLRPDIAVVPDGEAESVTRGDRRPGSDSAGQGHRLREHLCVGCAVAQLTIGVAAPGIEAAKAIEQQAVGGTGGKDVRDITVILLFPSWRSLMRTIAGARPPPQPP